MTIITATRAIAYALPLTLVLATIAIAAEGVPLDDAPPTGADGVKYFHQHRGEPVWTAEAIPEYMNDLTGQDRYMSQPYFTYYPQTLMKAGR